MVRLFFLVMMPKKNLPQIHQVPSSGRRLESCSWTNDPKSGYTRDILAEWVIQGQWEADRVYHTYSELGRVGLTTSRLGSLEFILGCRLLLELGMLFALEETDSKLELMMLFLCSCFSVDGTAWKSVRGLSLQDGGLESLLFFLERCSWALVRGTSGTVLNIFS